MSFTPAVREVVEFARQIPGFCELSQHDQVSLLKAGTFEVQGSATPIRLLIHRTLFYLFIYFIPLLHYCNPVLWWLARRC